MCTHECRSNLCCDVRSWQQRYWAGWEYYKQGGPVFLLIGGEGEENPGWLQAGALHDYANQFGGLRDFDFLDQGEVEGGRKWLQHKIEVLN